MASKKAANKFMVLLAVLIVLAAVAILLTDPFGWLRPSEEEQQQADPTQRVLVAAAKDDITALQIVKPGEDPFKLERDGGKWYLTRGAERYRANQERVDAFLEDLPGLKSLSLATDKPDKHATFEVEADKGVKLEVYAGSDAPAVQLVVGKADPSYQSAFVRLGDAPEVYRSSKNVKSLIGFAFNDYRSKKPWSFDPELLTEMTVRPPDGGGAPVTFTKKDGLWKTPAGGNGNQNALNELAKKISELSIGQFMDEYDEQLVKLAGVEPSLVFKAPDEVYTLTVGGKESSNYYVKDADGIVYQIGEYYLKPYLEVEFDKLTFDDTPQEQPAAAEETTPDEGVNSDIKSDAEENGAGAGK